MPGHTISMDGSKYGWEDVDIYCKKLHLNRSEYVQKLIEKDMSNNKLNRFYKLFPIGCMIAILGLQILIIWLWL